MENILHDACQKIFDSDTGPIVYDYLSLFELQLCTPIMEIPVQLLKEIDYLDTRIKEVFKPDGHFIKYFEESREFGDNDRIALKFSEIEYHLTNMSLTYKIIHDYLELIYQHDDELPTSNQKVYLSRLQRELRLLRLYLDGDGVSTGNNIYNQGAYYFYQNVMRPTDKLHVKMSNYLRYKVGRAWYDGRFRRHKDKRNLI